ncbi:MAG: sodium/proton antiporter, NhaA family [Nitrospira sp.]|jgi:NhaA family Na+:H+ antiporter|nr:sodium/proton antiporter, NhaA family [Nitrospira sp.]
MVHARPTKLDRPVDSRQDHILGSSDADITLVEYGSYACRHCQAAQEIIDALRNRFGTRMRYVFRHRPIPGSDHAKQAAELAEYVSEATGQFWTIHQALMNHGPTFRDGDLERIASDLNLSAIEARNEAAHAAAAARVAQDVRSALHSGVLETPTFFINRRRYEGPWDESSLAEAMLGSLGQRLHTATVDFVRWGPSAGLSLLLMSVVAVLLANSPFGPPFQAWWGEPLGVQLGGRAFALPLLEWVNDGLLTIFFLVVGLEIKREFTVGRLATPRAAALPVIAALGGMIAPALIYLLIVPSGPLHKGWGMTIATDTAFAVALLVLLGNRVPVELRVFLTAAVIMDDLVAIALIAFFYTEAIDLQYLLASVAVTGLLGAFNRWGVYRSLPYGVVGVALWACLHGAGLHATLAGVILAVVTPTRPPANLRALMAQAEGVIRAEIKRAKEALMQQGPSEPALLAMDVIHDRIESPASKLLRSIEPWSSYIVLPLFALANAGVVWSLGAFEGHGRLMSGIVLGLVLGKPVGIFTAAWLAARLGVAVKPAAYSWRQLLGAGALAGIGFTMSLFIAGQAFQNPRDYVAAKIAIFIASLMAGVTGIMILWTRRPEENRPPPA